VGCFGEILCGVPSIAFTRRATCTREYYDLQHVHASGVVACAETIWRVTHGLQSDFQQQCKQQEGEPMGFIPDSHSATVRIGARWRSGKLTTLSDHHFQIFETVRSSSL